MIKGSEENFKLDDSPKTIWEEQQKGWQMESDVLGPFIILSFEEKSVSLANHETKTFGNIAMRWVESWAMLVKSKQHSKDKRHRFNILCLIDDLV